MKTCPHCGCSIEEKPRIDPRQAELVLAAIDRAADRETGWARTCDVWREYQRLSGRGVRVFTTERHLANVVTVLATLRWIQKRVVSHGRYGRTTYMRRPRRGRPPPIPAVGP